MKIIIAGAGRVGGTLAEHLVHENNDVTLIDINEERLQFLQSRLDIRTVVGSGADPDSLFEAGCKDADMIIAVTSLDETNMITCEVAYTLFQTPTKIARIRSKSMMEHPEIFRKIAVPIDVCISPEELVTNYIKRLIYCPGALQVLDFAGGGVQLIALRPDTGGPFVGKSLANLHDYIPEVNMRIVAIYRHNRSIPIKGSTAIEAGDEVFILATPAHILEIINALGRMHLPYQKIFIAGGGNIGSRLALALEEQFQVKVIEHSLSCATKLSTTLNHTIVLHGDASDRDLLHNENIEYADVFCAVTNDDEANIMSCIQAKKFGVRQVMALINRASYVDLVDGSAIDIAISPQQITIGSILKHIRRGDIANIYSLRRGAAEAIEIVAHGDMNTSRVVGKSLAELKLPSSAMVGALVRNDKVMMARDDLVIESQDHVILFLAEKKHLSQIEHLFQVKISYFG